MEDLLSVLPFGGTFDLVQLKGATLRKAFEFSARRYGQGTGEFLQVSGQFQLFETWSGGCVWVCRDLVRALRDVRSAVSGG